MVGLEEAGNMELAGFTEAMESRRLEGGDWKDRIKWSVRIDMRRHPKKPELYIYKPNSTYLYFLYLLYNYRSHTR